MREMRRPTSFATGYVAVSAALAALVLLTDLTYVNCFLALIVLNLPVSLPAYFLVNLVSVFGQPIGDDLFWVRVVCYVIWMTLVVVQAAGLQAICRQYRQASPFQRG